MILLLLGATAMGYLAVALFFVRFWNQTRDRFFLFFAASFALEGFNRAATGFFPFSGENDAVVFSIRLVSYLLIALAILDKNVSRFPSVKA